MNNWCTIFDRRWIHIYWTVYIMIQDIHEYLTAVINAICIYVSHYLPSCYHCRCLQYLNLFISEYILIFTGAISSYIYTGGWVEGADVPGTTTSQIGGWVISSTLPEKNCVEELLYGFQQNMFPRKYFSAKCFSNTFRKSTMRKNQVSLSYSFFAGRIGRQELLDISAD